MKVFTWILTLAVTLWPTGYHGFATNTAYGASSSSTGTGSGTSTASGTSTGSSTGTKTCTDNRTTYQGHTDNNCYAYDTSNSQDNQRNTQNNNRDMNDQSSQQSSMMGMMAIMAGMAMMAAGAAMMASPPTMPAGAALMAAGAMLLAAGMAAMAAAKQMKDNANKSNVNGYNMDNLPTSTISGTPTDTNKTLADSKTKPASGSSLSIDPAVLAPGGKSDTLVEDFETKTGISRAELVEGLNNGQNPIDMLAASSAMKKAGVGADKIGSLVADAQSSGNMPSGGELLDKIGMSSEDIAAMAAKNASMGGDDSLAAGGAGGSSGSSRSPASGSTDYSFAGAGKDGAVTSGNLGSAASFATPGSGHLSDSVQNALDRGGITSRSLFQMVHEQYKKKMPMMFGAQERKAASHSDNPFADLSKDKVEL